LQPPPTKFTTIPLSLSQHTPQPYPHTPHLPPGKSLDEFEGGTVIPKEDLLYLPCDVLIPAAIGGVIDEDNAGKLQCKFVAEAANGPTTPGVSCYVTVIVLLG